MDQVTIVRFLHLSGVFIIREVNNILFLNFYKKCCFSWLPPLFLGCFIMFEMTLWIWLFNHMNQPNTPIRICFNSVIGPISSAWQSRLYKEMGGNNFLLLAFKTQQPKERWFSSVIIEKNIQMKFWSYISKEVNSKKLKQDLEDETRRSQ